MIYGGAGLGALILVVFVGYQLTKSPEATTPVVAPAPVKKTVVSQEKEKTTTTSTTVVTESESEKGSKKNSKKTKVVTSEEKEEEEAAQGQEGEENGEKKSKKEAKDKKGKKSKATLEKAGMKEFFADGNTSFSEEISTIFDDLIEKADTKKERIKQEKEEVSERNKDKELKKSLEVY